MGAKKAAHSNLNDLYQNLFMFMILCLGKNFLGGNAYVEMDFGILFAFFTVKLGLL